MIIAGYIASILVGITLGLIGAGGSILTVPILIYIFGVDTVSATAYSLFIVGLTSAIGSIQYFRQGLIHLKVALAFGVPSVIAVFTTRKFIVPAIPDTLFSIGNFTLSKSMFILLVFAILMILASVNMIKKTKEVKSDTFKKRSTKYPVVFLQGLGEGTLTGLVGAGGGFLIVPVLVLVSRLSIKEAIGTSLLIIAVKSMIGFSGEHFDQAIDWNLIFGVSLFAISGLIVGLIVSKKIDGSKLKPAFGWFVLSMGIYILTKELFF